jgi:hypothetical protein
MFEQLEIILFWNTSVNIIAKLDGENEYNIILFILQVLLKIFCYGKQLLKRKMEVGVSNVILLSL